MQYASQAQAKYTPDSEGESGVRTALRGIHLENMQKQNQLTGNTAMSRTVLIAPHLPVRLEVILASVECSASGGRSKVLYATGDSLPALLFLRRLFVGHVSLKDIAGKKSRTINGIPL